MEPKIIEISILDRTPVILRKAQTRRLGRR